MSFHFQYSLEEFAQAAFRSTQDVTVNSMCAVFAESEVVSLRNRGFAAEDISRAVHLSVADRLVAMLERVGMQGDIVFSGGVARNTFLIKSLADKLGRALCIPEQPEVVGALGAALHL